MQLSEQVNKKWEPVLDHPDLPKITDAHKRAVTAICLENVEKQFVADQQITQGGGLLSETASTLQAQTTAVTAGDATTNVPGD